MKKQLLLTVMLLSAAASAFAVEVEIDGLWYEVVAKAKVAKVIQYKNDVYYKGDIVIPETVVYEDVTFSVTSIGNSAFESCFNLTSITIPNSVTSIGGGTFHNCSGLTSVTIPNSVTSIGVGAFQNCSGLTSITIPNSVTSIEYEAFSYCSGLTSVTIPNSVVNIGYNAFLRCSSLSSVTIPNSVTSIGGCAFYYCSGLTSVTIPNSVTSIGKNAFSYCSGLTSVTIPSSLTSIEEEMFSGCSALTSVTIPNSVTSIGVGAFQNCSGLTSITIPNSVTGIGQLSFAECSGLTSVVIGGGVKTIGSKAFANCHELTDVTCSAENVPSTQSDAFEGSYIEYSTLHIPESAINDYKNIEPWCNFGVIKTFTGEELNKCATPTIIIEDGKIKFYCETEGVDFISNVSTIDEKDYYDAELNLTYVYKVTVYAQKDGYKNSDIATAELMSTGIFGDLNGDGTVNVADHVKLTEIIMNQK